MNKGFTLMELLAVMIIMGILTIMLIPTSTNITNDMKRSTYEAKVKEVEIAALKYGEAIKDDIKNLSGSCMNTNINNLISLGYLTSEYDNRNALVNPINSKDMDGNIKICYCISKFSLEAYYIVPFNENNKYVKGDYVAYDNKVYKTNLDYDGHGGINKINSKSVAYFKEITC